MAGTVTGKNAKIYLSAHSGTAVGGEIAEAILYDSTKTHATWGISDFSLTLDRGLTEQSLLGEAGSFFKQGTLSAEGSLTAAKFATPGYCDLLKNMCDADETRYKYLMVSGIVSTDTDGATTKYFSWCLASCQVTGYDVSIGDADTITEASIDFVMLNPQDLTSITPGWSGVRG